MKKLFLAVVTLRLNEYMGNTRFETVTRLVWAVDTDEAELLLKRELEVDDPYGLGKSIDSSDITETLGSPS
jgi:hypothetical protein